LAVMPGLPGFQTRLTDPVSRSQIELNSNEWSVKACPDLKWGISLYLFLPLDFFYIRLHGQEVFGWRESLALIR